MDIDIKTLKKARAYAARRYSELLDTPEFSCCHKSHAVARALEDTEKRFALETFGVEGDCELNGGIDIQYLNTGDTYAPTVCYYRGRFVVSSFGDIVERAGA
jgi:hypothetical protein